MAGEILIGYEDDFAIPATVTANTADANFPASNAVAAANPGYVYKSATGTVANQWLKYDLGAVTNVLGVLIDNVNTVALRLDGAITDSFPSGGDERDITAVPDLMCGGRVRGYWDLRGTAYATGTRYLRVNPRNSTTVDGSTAWSVGGLTVLTAVDAFEVSSELQNPSDIEMVPLRAGARTPLSGGGRDKARRGLGRMQIALSAAVVESAGYDLYSKLLGSQFADLVFYRNNGNVSEAYRGDLAVVGGVAERYVYRTVSRTIIEEVA